jgi:Prealbumin-like fold domain
VKSKQWTGWESARHQVAIAGRVVGEGDRALAGAEVTIVRMPEAFQRRVAAGASDQCLTKTDGIYYFLDLPDGRYTVKGRDARAGAEMEKTVSVSRSKDGKVKMAVADLKLVGGGTK